MTPEKFRQIRKRLTSDKEELGKVFTPAVSADQIRRWEEGVDPIPNTAIQQLTSLSTVVEEQRLDILNNLYQNDPKTLYRMSYYNDDDFKKYQPEDYHLFRSHAVYTRFLIHLWGSLRPTGCYLYFTRLKPWLYERWLEETGRHHSTLSLQLWSKKQQKDGVLFMIGGYGKEPTKEAQEEYSKRAAQMLIDDLRKAKAAGEI